MRFHWIDLVVVLFVVRGVVIGHRRGLSGELLRFLGILCAIALSFKFYEAAADRFAPHLPGGRNVAIACGFSAVFLCVLALFYMLNQTLHHLARLPGVAALEKTGGAVLGGAKAFLFACAVLILLALVKVERISNAVSQDSFFGQMAISAVPGAYRLAVRVYPPAQALPAGDVIKELPAVRTAPAPAVSGGPGPAAKEKAAGEGAPRETPDRHTGKRKPR
ncbi:MAG: CvpA family protein [Chlamydiota bacterium]